MTTCIIQAKIVILSSHLETHEVDLISLKTMRIRMEKDNKNKSMIMITSPSETLVLKAKKEADLKKWHSAIYLAINYARAEKRKDDIEKQIKDLERMNAEFDKQSLTLVSNEIEDILHVKDGREILFNALSKQEVQYEYLAGLYMMICEYKKNHRNKTNALKIANIISMMLTERDKVLSEPLPSGDSRLSQNIKEVVNEIYPQSLKLTLHELSSGEELKEMDERLFKELEDNLILKFKEGYSKFSEKQAFKEELKGLLGIPSICFKRNIKKIPKLKFISKLMKARQLTNSPSGRKIPYSMSVINNGSKSDSLIADIYRKLNFDSKDF